MTLRRVAIISAIVAVIGSIVGALVGMAVMLMLILSRGDTLQMAGRPLLMAAGFGAAVGAVFAPAASWLLLRHVPLWRSITETAAGTLLGAAVATFLAPVFVIPAAAAGFLLAAARLRIFKSRKSTAVDVKHSDR